MDASYGDMSNEPPGNLLLGGENFIARHVFVNLNKYAC